MRHGTDRLWWHRCQRWWEQGIGCPYSKGIGDIQEDDEDDPDQEPFDPRQARPLIQPEIPIFADKLVPPVEKDITEGLEDLTPDEVPLPLPLVPPIIPFPLPKPEEDDQQEGETEVPRPLRKAAIERAHPYPLPKERVAWSVAGVSRELSRDFDEGPDGQRLRPQESSVTKLNTAQVFESRLAEASGRSSRRADRRERNRLRTVGIDEQSETGFETPRARERVQIWDYRGISDRQNAATDRRRAAAKAAAATAAAVGTGYLIRRGFGGGGRGGGFHRPARTFRPGERVFN